MTGTRPRILSTCCAAGAGAALALFVAACGGVAAPIEVRDRFACSEGGGTDLRVLVQPEHRRDSDRYRRAALASLATFSNMIGSCSPSSLTIVDPPYRRPQPPDPSVVMLERVPWWSTRTAMAPELATARALWRRCWSASVDTGNLPSWFVDGLVEYTARRIVAPIFEGENLPPGYAMVETRTFGGFVPRFIRLRRLPESGGEPTVDSNRDLARSLLTLNTLERWLGRPALDGALAAFVRAARGRRPSLADFERAVSDASGQDLSWLFAQTFDAAAAFDYAVSALASVPTANDSYETTVVVDRLGEGSFTGTGRPRVGPFESGRGMTIRVTFDDGSQIDDHWDGRDRQRRFVYVAATRAISATIDPDRVVVLDVHQTNNGRSLATRTASASARWSARWSLWLEDVLLVYASIM